MKKKSASFILNDFAEIINDTIDHFDKQGKIKSPLYKEGLKFESIAFLFWLFQKSDIFPVEWFNIILDEIHNQYFERLRKHGYDFKMRESVGNEFNLRYQRYNDALLQKNDESKIGVIFVKFLNEKAKSDSDVSEILIPIYIMEKTKVKFQTYRNVVNSEGNSLNSVL